MSMARSRSSRPTIFLTIFCKKPGFGVTSAAVRRVPTYSNCEGNNTCGGLVSASLAGHDQTIPNTTAMPVVHMIRCFDLAVRPKIHLSEEIKSPANAEPVAVDVQSTHALALVEDIVNITETSLHADPADVVLGANLPQPVILRGTDQLIALLAVRAADFKVVLRTVERAEVGAVAADVQERAVNKLGHRERDGDEEVPLQRVWEDRSHAAAQAAAGEHLQPVAFQLSVNRSVVASGVAGDIQQLNAALIHTAGEFDAPQPSRF